MQKLNIAIIFGGRSAEHEISVISARNIIKAINKKRYNISLIGIDRNGRWLFCSEEELLSEKKLFLENKKSKNAMIIPYTKKEKFFLRLGKNNKLIDVVFPVLHGPFGEDGTIQGLLKLFNAPFVGSGVSGSAICMDKDISKRLLKEANIPVANFLVFKNHQKNNLSFNKIKNNFSLPFFIKPANLGSSVGISKVKNKNEFNKAIKKAFSYDNKIIIEEFIKGKEIECSVLGNLNPIASILGEIIPMHDFYSYEAKYLDENGAKMAIPANIPKSVIKKIQKLAIKTFETLSSGGMGRVDFFLTAKNKIFVNEINTIPGFTSFSMYPKLLEHSGVSYSKLIDRLIELAIERYNEENQFKIHR
ncbi:D-alanine--D-alanine ligase [Candidatus Parcubacteria bacterium]|nr:D-alanine--D-alanine ligase [Candidatus Parcubacteria bacterium]